jgi:phosphoglycerol transferase
MGRAIPAHIRPRPARGFRCRTRIVPVVAMYAGSAMLAMVLAAWALRLWEADLAIPFHRQSGDGLFYDMIVKNLITDGRVNVNRWLGAPGQLDLHDFPQPNLLHHLLIRLISLFTSDFGVVLNAYFLLTFPLGAVTSLFTLRRLGIGRPAAIVSSLLFPLLPFHFERGEAHLVYSSYYLVPLIGLTALWLCTGEQLFRRRGEGDQHFRGWVTAKGIFAVVCCVLAALDTAYSALFGGFLVATAACAGRLRFGHVHALRSGAVLVTILVLTFASALAPHVVYSIQHGPNGDVASRQPGEAEFFGLKIVQMLLPAPGHRMPPLAALKERYEAAPLVNENRAVSLGLVGSIGFMTLIAWLLFGRPPDPTLRRSSTVSLDELSVLNAACVLLATIGGFSSLFALVVSAQWRAYNRIAALIGFLAFTAVSLVLDRLHQAWVRPSWRPTRDRGLYVLLMVALVVIGVLDQTTPQFVPDYRGITTEFRNSANFVRAIENSLPRRAMIFQLPYVPFPEAGDDARMGDYDHLRGYLHSTELRWSYGAMRGREGDAWARTVANAPIPEMVRTLVFAGFSGIYVDRFGYSDGARQVETELAEALQTRPMVSADQRQSFFDLASLRAAFHGEYTAAQWRTREEAALHPMVVNWEFGCYEPEGTPENRWRWCSSNAHVYIFNLAPVPRTIILEMSVSTGHPEPSRLRIMSVIGRRRLLTGMPSTPWLLKDVEVTASEQVVSETVTVPPGRHFVRITSDARNVEVPGDPRRLVFRVRNFDVRELNASRGG